MSYVFDRTDELVSETAGSTTTATYDAFGNQTRKPEDDLTATTLAYDGADRLIGISPALGSSAVLTYDALSRPRTRTVGTSTDTYGYLGPSKTAYG